MGKPVIKLEHLDQIEELSEEDLKSISGGKSVMPSGELQNYRLLKIRSSLVGDTLTAVPTVKK